MTKLGRQAALLGLLDQLNSTTHFILQKFNPTQSQSQSKFSLVCKSTEMYKLAL